MGRRLYTRYMAEWDRRVGGEIVPSDNPNESVHLLRVPVGAGGAICTVIRVEQELAFGEICINRTVGEAMQAHYSGHRESGTGGEDGKHGLLRYTQLKAIYHRYA